MRELNRIQWSNPTMAEEQTIPFHWQEEQERYTQSHIGNLYGRWPASVHRLCNTA